MRRVDGDGHAGAPEIGGEEDADDPGRAAGRRHIDGADAGMRVRRAQHGGVQAAGHAEVVDELSGAGDEPRVLAATNAPRVLGHFIQPSPRRSPRLRLVGSVSARTT